MKTEQIPVNYDLYQNAWFLLSIDEGKVQTMINKFERKLGNERYYMPASGLLMFTLHALYIHLSIHGTSITRLISEFQRAKTNFDF